MKVLHSGQKSIMEKNKYLGHIFQQKEKIQMVWDALYNVALEVECLLKNLHNK